MKNKIMTLKFSKDECPSVHFIGDLELMEKVDKVEHKYCKEEEMTCEKCYKLTREELLKA